MNEPNPKSKILIVGIVALAIIVGILFFIFSQKPIIDKIPTRPGEKVEKKEVVKPILKTGLEIAQANLLFIDKVFEPDWRMVNVGWTCSGQGTTAECKKTNMQHHHSGWYGSAYAYAWEKTKNDAYLSKAKHIFDGRILHPDGVGTIDECLTQDQALIADLKARGGGYHADEPAIDCIGSFMGYDEWHHLQERNKELVKNEKAVQAMKKGAEWLVKTGQPSSGPPFRYLDIGKLAHMYQMTNEKKYLDEAKKRLETETTFLQKEEAVIYYGLDQAPFRGHQCWIDWGISELYRATKDKSYLEELESSMQKLQVAANKELIDGAEFLMLCGTVLMNLHEDTNKVQYKNDAITLMEHLLQNFWDSEFLPKYNGDNGLLGLQYEAGKDNTKSPLWTVYLIRELAHRLSDVNLKIGEIKVVE